MPALNVARYRSGNCVQCRRTIARGDQFCWGPASGSWLCPSCAGVFVGTPVLGDGIPADPQQQAVVDHVAAPNTGSLLVEAYAGTGKTFTIEKCAARLAATAPHRSAVYYVFAARNAAEAKKKLAPYPQVTPSTFHSAGLRALMAYFGWKHSDIDRVKVDNKVNLILAGLPDVSEAEMDAFGADIVQLVHLAKCAGVAAGLLSDTEEAWNGLVDHFGVTFNLPQETRDDSGDVDWEMADAKERGIELARRVLRLNNSVVTKGRTDITIDFDDMLYQTVRLNLTLPKADIVFVDEAQDTNAVRRAMVSMTVQPGSGKVVAVGDRHQAIMGFTGADAESLDLLQRSFNMATLPIAVNYRCDQAIIEVAREWVPDIQWSAPKAGKGVVAELTSAKLTDFRNTDAVLCRFNAPVVGLWYKFFAAGIPAQVLGRDLGKGIIALVAKLQGKRKSGITLDALVERANRYAEREVARWTAKGDESKAQAAQDRVDCLLAAVDAVPEAQRTVAGLLDYVNTLTAHSVDAKDGASSDELPPVLTLCTIHKSKGLEFDRVFILDWSQLPAKWARAEWQLEQESNLQYVAVTRARHELYFIDSDKVAAKEAAPAAPTAPAAA